jgi:hypothetical protein
MIQLVGSNRYTSFEFYAGTIQSEGSAPSINSIIDATGSGVAMLYNPFISIPGYNSGGGAVIGSSAANVLIDNGYNSSANGLVNGTHYVGTLNATMITNQCARTQTLSSGTSTVNNTCISTSRPVLCTDQTSVAAVRYVPSTGSLSIYGTGSDVVSWAQM